MPRTRTGDQQLRQEAAQREARRQKEKAVRIQDRKLLQKMEPVVYEGLNQELAGGDAVHAHLLAGSPSPLKDSCALLLAQSLFLHADHLIEEESLAAEDALAAQRIAEGSHADFLRLQGSANQSISLEQIQEVSALFSRTAAEAGGRKIYILSHAEYMSLGAMNGLLKFLEEPAENVYAILTTDQTERILPTVQSRCVQLLFHSPDPALLEQTALAEGTDPEDAFLLSVTRQLTHGYDKLAASPSYQKAKSMFRQWLGLEGDRELLYCDYDLREKNTGKDELIEELDYFFGFCLQFARDALQGSDHGPAWYHKEVLREARLPVSVRIEKFRIVAEEKERVSRYNDLNLVLAQAMYRWEVLQ